MLICTVVSGGGGGGGGGVGGGLGGVGNQSWMGQGAMVTLKSVANI